jgi:hypothetical protein
MIDDLKRNNHPQAKETSKQKTISEQQSIKIEQQSIMNTQKFIEEISARVLNVDKKFEIVDYSDKSVAFFGHSIALKEHLKEFYAKYNANLTHPTTGNKQAGWIIPKNQSSKLIKFVNKFYGDEKTHITELDVKAIVEEIFKKNAEEIEKKKIVKNNMSDYNTFVAENMEKIKKQTPDMPFGEAMEIIAKLWSEKETSSDDDM